MTDATTQGRSLPAGPPEGRDLRELAVTLAAGFIRLLAARNVAQAGQIPLDSESGSKAPLSERGSRRTKRA